MKIEIIKLEELKPLEQNVRRHNEKQIAELMRSVEQFGQTRAIIIDEENNILIGNGLYEALLKRGDKTAECSRIKGLSEKSKKKLVLSDNKIFSLGSDDYNMIQNFIKDITIDGDFDIAGFDDEILKSMQRDFTEIEKDISNYGMIPQSEENFQPHKLPKAEEQQLPPPIINNNINEENSHIPEHIAEVKNDRTVVCPNCGEIIHLD